MFNFVIIKIIILITLRRVQKFEYNLNYLLFTLEFQIKVFYNIFVFDP